MVSEDYLAAQGEPGVCRPSVRLQHGGRTRTTEGHETRLNVRAYRTIPTVAEILVVHSGAVVAEVLRRKPDGAWPEQPEVVDAASELRLDSIGFAAPLREAYRTTNLA
jgi:hypothetical protein